jgi:hypothetical protein
MSLRVGHNRPVAERPWPELGAALEPRDDEPVRDHACCHELGILERVVAKLAALEHLAHLRQGEALAEILARDFHRALATIEEVLDDQRRPDRRAGVASRRVEEELLELRLALEPAVGHAVERHAPRHAQVLGPCQLARQVREVKHRLLGDRLQGEGDVLVPLLDRALGHARRPEQGHELVAVAMGAIVEVFEV